MFVTTFTVTGRGEFPFDMLRYDGCFPARGEDAALLYMTAWRIAGKDRGSTTPPRRVRLQRHHARKPSNLTPARWRSFGWTVDMTDDPPFTIKVAG